MPDDTVREFANSDRGLVVAPAGCGKTELIVRAVAANGERGRQLILTHTNAGVRALLDRLRKRGIPGRSYRVETIDGWALKYARAYPSLSGWICEEGPMEAAQWNLVRSAASKCLTKTSIRKVVTQSYSGVYVDEYQDCTGPQHKLILMLAELLPCRIVGDPLQGIFDFDGGIDWSKEVQPCFPLLHRLDKPWRWQKNPQLGEWLQTVRILLATGQEIDLITGPISWETHEPRTALSKCLYLPVNSGESVVALMGKVENQSRAFAAKLKGRFTHMEVVECKPLLNTARKLDCLDGPARAVVVIDFACTCMSGVKSVLKKARDAFAKELIPKISSKNKNGKVVQTLIDLTQDRSEEAILQAVKQIEALPDRVIHGRELWQEFKRVVQECSIAKAPLADLARKRRESTRYMGRRVDRRTVSRTLLVKGLEFDHAVVLNASSKDLDAKNFYVAITRGSKSLTILSDSAKITKPAPNINPQFL